ncbi:asparaginase [Paracoccus saliphilus]|uniref:Asparaginase n=1 Tax=Paracoccus saliphilus TaxID=405559 RepID=A0AA46A5J3_9RHOB|nr:asparaginase [Paracoccus saliphilus]WCR04164.1 asparaginase [Paracoccus saliphilus]SIS81608.1 L-asparaginase [Paracoccus saliphilus]
MKICILNTGGTISSVGSPLAPMSAARFAEAAEAILAPMIAASLPGMELHFDNSLRFSDHGTGALDSTNLQPRDWCRIADAVLNAYADHDGFVILHGTDTMDFTGAALPLLLNVTDEYGFGRAVLSKPVILTGAQLPMFRDTPEGLVLNAGSDAFANFCGALACARLRIPELALFFDGKLLRGNRAVKVSTTRFAAFESPHLPPLAETGIEAWHGHATALPGPAAPHLSLDDPEARRMAHERLSAIDAAMDRHPVIQLNAFPTRFQGDSPLARMIGDAVAAGIRGIVLESYGEGNFPSGDTDDASQGAICKALKAATQAGVVVVDGTRVIGGQVGEFHYAAGAWMAEAGAISAGDMTPMAAFAKTMILSAAAEYHGWNAATLRAMIRRSLAGECSSADRLDSRLNPVLNPGQSLSAADGAARLVNDPDHGIALTGADGKTLWSPAPDRPGRLVLPPNGRLACFTPDGTALWQQAAPEKPMADACLLLRCDPQGQPVLELRGADGVLATSIPR